ncbi:MAG: hypothetical protein QG657_4297 [Acidobacteriota bacterium]|nr:hypothetical protein [Acidobacteriota bacterium]
MQDGFIYNENLSCMQSNKKGLLRGYLLKYLMKSYKINK